jgi:hypothetical protein
MPHAGTKVIIKFQSNNKVKTKNNKNICQYDKLSPEDEITATFTSAENGQC